MTLSPPAAVSIRKAVSADRDAVAELHIASMQRTYRPFLSEEYLTKEMPVERRARWAERFVSDLAPNYIVLVADEEPDALERDEIMARAIWRARIAATNFVQNE